jgi:hypothetical protein
MWNTWLYSINNDKELTDHYWKMFKAKWQWTTINNERHKRELGDFNRLVHVPITDAGELGSSMTL